MVKPESYTFKKVVRFYHPLPEYKYIIQSGGMVNAGDC